MNQTSGSNKKPGTADWLFRGILSKFGDTVDRFTGRRWIPSSSLATSELIERIKAMLDNEARSAAGGGVVVPHNIRLKVQWNKFSIENEELLRSLENELLAATIDHINNKLYYTNAPVSLEVKADYFTEGMRVLMNFGDDLDEDAESSVALPSRSAGDIQISEAIAAGDKCMAAFSIDGVTIETEVAIPAEKRITVGRTAENLLRIDDTSVSKYHASIGVDDGGRFTVSDIGSTNGTFVNGERLSYGTVIPLSDADRLKFGSVDVELRYVPAPRVERLPELETERPVTIGGFEFRSRTDATNASAAVDSGGDLPVADQAPMTDIDLNVPNDIEAGNDPAKSNSN